MNFLLLNDLIISIENGNRPKGGVSQISEGVPSVGGEHVNSSGGFVFDNIKYVPREFYESMKRGKIQFEDILIVKDGATTGKVSFVSSNFPYKESAVNEHVFILRVNKEKIISRYLFYILYSKYGQSQILRNYHGSAIGGINSQFVNFVSIPVPPIEVQKKIVTILERGDKLKQRREQTNKEIKKAISSIFAEMFGDPTKNGKNFPVKTLDEISVKINDGTHFTPKYMDSGIPFLRVTDITNSNESKKFISKEEHRELMKRCKPEKGDVLYTKNGTIGIAKTIDWDYEFSIFVSLCLIKPKKEEILPKYLEVFLNTPFALSQALKHSKKGTITNLHLIEIKKMLVPVPPIKKQQEFLRIIEKIELIKNYQLNVTREISGLFDALMQKAFNGEIK